MVVPARPPTFVLTDDSLEWNRMWALIARANKGDPVCEDPGTRECWQYMGTWWSGYHFRHHFRHRQLRGARQNLSVPASKSWEPGDGLTPADAEGEVVTEGVNS